ncbi:PD40 domain-containing protein [bacterium]|nr:PD40 domain-containing protein [bacterium]
MRNIRIALCLFSSVLCCPLFSQPVIIQKDAEPKLVSEGDYVYGIWMDDSTIITTKTSYNGIYKINLNTGEVAELLDAKWVGYHLAIQNSHGKVIFQNKVKFERQISQVNLAKEVKPISPLGKQVSFPWVHKNILFYMEGGEPRWFDKDGQAVTPEMPFAYYEFDSVYGVQGNQKWFIAGGNDLYYSVTYSPTGDRIALEGLNEGIYISDFRGENTVLVGKGNNPTWSPNGKFIVFDRSKDDGYKIFASDIYAHDGTKEYKLTSTWDYIERYPVISPDGTKLLFVSDGSLYYLPVKIQ